MQGIYISEYTFEVTHPKDFTPDYIDYVCRLCDERSKNLKERNDNYSYERMKSSFQRKRFAHGFYVMKCHGKVIATFGIDDFQGWAVGTRLLRHNSTNTTLLPVKWFWKTPIKDNLKNVKGLCTTQNLDQRNVIGRVARREERTEYYASLYGPESIFAASLDVINNTKKLDGTVLYRNTVQEVYTFYTDKVPPFEKYSGSL